MDRRRERAWGIVYALFCGSLYSLPLFVAIRYNADFTYFANESLAYRYFLSERLSSGNYAWIWQGHLTTSIQNLIYLVVDRHLAPSASDFHLRLQLFSLLTLGFNVALTTSLFVIAGQTKRLDWLDRFLVALIPLAPLYATISGSYYHLAPDYWALNVILAAGAVLLFQCEWRSQTPPRSLVKFALLGGYCGLLVSNKIYMGILGIFIIGPFLLSPPFRMSSLALRTIVALAGALLVLCMVLLTFYSFEVGALRRMLGVWVDAMVGLGGDANFWTEVNLRTYWSFAALWLGATIIVVVNFLGNQTRQNGILIVCNAIGALAALFVLIKRPAGTTSFEVAVLFLAFTAMLITSVPRTKPYLVASTVTVVGLVLIASCTLSISHAFSWIAASSAMGRARWQLHTEIMRMADGRRVITVIPGNDYAYGGVQELLLKGAADFPTWNVSASGQRIIDRYASGMTFRHAYGSENSPNAPYPRNVLVLWWDKPDGPPIVEKYPALREAVNRQDIFCREWKQPEIAFEIKACLLP
jgi:hypothetical protein